MKSSLPRAVSLAVCLALVLSFASCNRGAGQPSSASPTTAGSTAADTGTAPTASQTEEESTDPSDTAAATQEAVPTKTASKGVKKTTVTTTQTTPTAAKQAYTVNGTPRAYLTTPKTNVKFVRQATDSVKVYAAGRLDRNSGIVIDIDAQKTYQTIEGFGASMTDTSAHNLYLLPEEVRDDVMDKCFDAQKGIGLTFLRQPIGPSDFSLEYTTYDDMPAGEEDYELAHFSIDQDRKQIIPLIKQAMKIQPGLRVVASCWSPPLWMKTKPDFSTLNKAELRLECYDVFAQYLIAYVQAYEKEGIPIYAMTPQNEPTGVHGIPATYYSYTAMARLVNNHLRPAMDAAGIKTKLWCWDFNWFEDDAINYLSSMYDAVEGMAFHFYSGEPTVMGNIHELFPDMPIYITEAAGQVQSQNAQLFRQIKYITAGLRNHVSSWICWNIMLDQDLGPTCNNLNQHGVGLTELNTETKRVSYNMDYYALAHYSKFIHPGAVLVDSTDTGSASDGLYLNIVARNGNGTMTAVLGNQSAQAVTYKLVLGDQVIEYALPAQSVVTLTWDANRYTA